MASVRTRVVPRVRARPKLGSKANDVIMMM